jgi:hypothetical protein
MSGLAPTAVGITACAEAEGARHLGPCGQSRMIMICAPAGRLIASDQHRAVGSRPRLADGCRQPVPVGWLDRFAGGYLDLQPVKESFRLTTRRKDVNFINIRPE